MRSKIADIIKQNFKYFIFFYKYLKGKLLLVIVSSFLVGLLDALSISIFIPLLTSTNSNTTVVEDDGIDLGSFFQILHIPKTINWILAVMLFFFLLKAIFRYLDVHYRVFLTSYFIKAIRSRLLFLISNLKYSKFVQKEQGAIQNSISKECDNVIYGYTQYISVFQNIIFVGVYLSMSFFVNPKFTLIVIFGGWFSNFIFKKVYINSSEISSSISQKNSVFMSLVLQQIANYKYLKATSRVDKYKNKVEDVMNDIENDQMKLGYISGIVLSLREPILLTFLVGAIYIHINIMNGEIGAILFTLLLFYRSFNSLMAVQTSWTGFLKYVGSIQHIDVFQKELSQSLEVETGEKFTGFADSITFQNVSFQYATTSEKIIEEIAIEIPKNKTIAFVGKSGSGKTTLMNLLLGLLEPTSGKVGIDNKDLKDYDLNSFREKIGFIAQETVVFNDTIFNNVTFWDEKNEENLARFKEVMQKVDLSSFLNLSEEKENLILGDNGVVMSGGQRQRLSIARELYRETEILLLDEATSALDSETEKLIQHSIDLLKGSVTIIIIAHRLSTIKNVDTIFILENGKVQDSGNFESLLETSSTFAEMVKHQIL